MPSMRSPDSVERKLYILSMQETTERIICEWIYRNVEERKRTQTTRLSLSTNRRRYREVVSLNCVERARIVVYSNIKSVVEQRTNLSRSKR